LHYNNKQAFYNNRTVLISIVHIKQYHIQQYPQLSVFYSAYNKHTFAASMGLKAMSAKNSADAEAARYSEVRHTYVFSSPSKLE
jgi:hypothetical protein